MTANATRPISAAELAEALEGPVTNPCRSVWQMGTLHVHCQRNAGHDPKQHWRHGTTEDGRLPWTLTWESET